MTTTHIGKYEVVRRLGGGGMAEVFLAKALGAEGFARPVAIKRVLPSYSADPKFAQMFINEARLTAGLRHANIVSTLDFDRDAEGGLFLVMELVEGPTLEVVLQSGPLPATRALRIATQVAEALRAASAQCVVHRELLSAHLATGNRALKRPGKERGSPAALRGRLGGRLGLDRRVGSDHRRRRGL